MAEGPRSIVHLDLDAFYASVEVLEDPSLEGKPVVVGGSPEGRGVISSASYPARRYGIRSAMPTARALALCPSVIVVRPRHRLYSEYSRRVMEILRLASPLIEQLSIDEAFLDLGSQVGQWDDSVDLARQLQMDVLNSVGLSSSLGVATNKLVAKVASDRDKPGGLTVVRPGDEAAFLAPLSVRVLWGIGAVTARKLAEMQITMVGQLAGSDEALLRERFGRHGPAMVRHARGVDSRPVRTGHSPRSVSQERTFHRDLADFAELESRLLQLSEGVSRRLQKMSLAATTIAVKLRYSDFSTFSRQMSLSVPTNDAKVLYQAALALFGRAWDGRRPVRLLGIAARHLTPSSGQLALW